MTPKKFVRNRTLPSFISGQIIPTWLIELELTIGCHLAGGLRFEQPLVQSPPTDASSSPLNHPAQNPAKILPHNSMKSFPTLALVLAGALLVAATHTPLPAQQAAAPSPVTGLLRLSSVTELKTAIGGFAEAIQPGSSAMLEQAVPMAMQFGIDPAGEIVVLFLNPQQTAMPFAVVVPVSDPSAVAANPMLGMQKGEGDSYTLMIPGQTESMTAAFMGKQLVIAPMPQNIEIVKGFIGAGGYQQSVQQLRAGGGQLALTIALDQLYTAYKPMLDVMLMGLKSSMSQAQAAPGQPNPAAMAGQIDSFVSLLADAKGLGLRFNVQPTAISLGGVLTAKPGTKLASFINLEKGGAAPALSSFSADSAVLGSFSMKPTAEFYKNYNEFIVGMLTSSGAEGAAAAPAITKFVNDFAATWDGTGAFGFMSPTAETMGTAVYGITDSAKAMAMVKGMPALQQSFAGITAASGMKTTSTFGGEEGYKGATLLDVTTSYSATSEEGKEALKGMSAMGMDGGFPAVYAITNRQMVSTLGKGAKEAAKQYLDGNIKNGATISPKDFGFADDVNMFMAFSIPRIMSWAAKQGGATGIPASAIPAGGRHGLGIAFTGNAGGAQLQLHMSAEEIKTLTSMGAGAMAPADSE